MCVMIQHLSAPSPKVRNQILVGSSKSHAWIAPMVSIYMIFVVTCGFAGLLAGLGREMRGAVKQHLADHDGL